MDFNFKIERITEFGDKVYVVGNLEQFGNWNPKNGIELSTNKKIYPLWESKPININHKKIINFEYKYVTIKSNGDIVWEEGANRSIINKLIINNCIFNKSISYRTPQNICFTDRNKNFKTMFSALSNLNNIFLKIQGDIVSIKYSKIIKRDYANKLIYIKVPNNIFKISKIHCVLMPYYIVDFKSEENVKLYGPFNKINQ